MSLRFLFRVDAALEIGSGHVMRCLTLAAALRTAGHQCQFVCRRREGDLTDMIEAKGFGCTVLPETEDSKLASTWLGATLADEIIQSRAVVAEQAPDWIVVDHYSLASEWESAVTSASTRVMVIDDLASRQHDCDLLLDQGLTHTMADYIKLTPTRCRLLLGSRYILLREEFSKLRAAAEARNRAWPPTRIFVSLGGIDPDNATQAVLETLATSALPSTCKIDVVMGRNAPHIAHVRSAAEASRFNVQVSVDVNDMGARMLAADLAIGAAGTTSWERISVGLPSLLLSIADNQLDVARALAAAGAAIDIGPIWDHDWRGRLIAGLEALAMSGRLVQMSTTCLALVDDAGSARVVQALDAPLAVRQCGPEDAERVWLWREADGAPKYYRSGRSTPWPEHAAWFARALNTPDAHLLMATRDGHPFGHIRIDLGKDPDTGLIGICLAPEKKGQGLGTVVLSLCIDHAARLGLKRLLAEVHCENTASCRVFETSGFRVLGTEGDFLVYERILNQSE